ncbi:MAG: hypothetical protein KGS72_03315 [Cyanobacteria bacterium REEB67]|nr:hypothetical protein [Cyanobacteria bacterium REEB67]
MIAFLPSTRPIQVRALSWREYMAQTDPDFYPPPVRRVLEVDETLRRKTRTDGTASVGVSEGQGEQDRQSQDDLEDWADEDAELAESGDEPAEEAAPALGFLQW